MAAIILKGGNAVEPSAGVVRKRDIWIENGRVSKISIAGSIRQGKSWSEDKWQVIDCEGLLIVPGLIDMHVHARTPGQEYKETLSTVSTAALAGGFTSIVCMANTNPAIDDAEKLHQLLIRAESESLVSFFQASAASKELKGREPVDFFNLLNSGASAFSDDGMAVQNPDLLLDIMNICSNTRRPLLVHCQDDRFDTYDKRSEYHYVSLALKIAQQFNLPLHIQHVSCAESVQLIREAKACKVRVTCETAPHYIALTSRDFKRIGVNAKMNPPLRSEKDRLAIIQGLVDGTIDVIATDHAPHTDEEKQGHHPPFGIIGLETAVPIVFSHLGKYLTVPQIIAKMTINPAEIFGLNLNQKGLIRPGLPADITVIDFLKRKVLLAEDLKSKSHNSPWLGKRMQTWPVLTIRNGKIMMRDGEIIL